MSVKKYEDFLREEKEDDDYSFLDKMLGRNKGIAPPSDDDPRLKFKLPDDFVGGRNVMRPRNPGFKPRFEEGDRIVYNNPKSDHNGKTGRFIRVREDGKFSVEFDDGTKFAGNGNNFDVAELEYNKKDFILKYMNLENEIGIQPIYKGEPYKDIVKIFPELINMEFVEEGDMLVYKGDLSKEEVLSELEERDFVVDKSI